MVAKRKVFLGAIAGSLIMALTAQGQDIDWKKGKLANLAPTIGTYRYDEVLGDANVSKALQALLPAPKAKVLRTNLETRNPIDFIDGYLVLSGNAPHGGGVESASLWIKIYDGKVHVALQESGKWTIHASDKKFEYMPLEFRRMIADRSVGGASQPPADVRWIPAP